MIQNITTFTTKDLLRCGEIISRHDNRTRTYMTRFIGENRLHLRVDRPDDLRRLAHQLALFAHEWEQEEKDEREKNAIEAEAKRKERL